MGLAVKIKRLASDRYGRSAQEAVDGRRPSEGSRYDLERPLPLAQKSRYTAKSRAAPNVIYNFIKDIHLCCHIRVYIVSCDTVVR